MPTFIPLDKNEHAGRTWRKPDNFAFAAREPLVPVVGLEVAVCAVNMPLAFTRNADGTNLVAVMSEETGRNKFVAANGSWLGPYIPAAFRSFPFRLLRIQGREDFAVCISGEGGYLLDRGVPGVPLYDATGDISPQTRQVVSVLQAFENSRQQTLLAAAALDEAGVLVPWPINMRGNPDSGSTVNGLLRIDENALNGLSDQQFIKLRNVGALALAYAQMLSVSRLDVLNRLSILAARTPVPQKELNLDFLREDDGDLLF